MSLERSAIRAASWAAISNWGGQALGFVVFVILARLVKPESFGLVAYATALTGFIQVFVRGGMGGAIVQREDLEPEHLDTAFWYTLGVGVVLGAVVAAAATPISAWLGEDELAPVLRALSVAFVLNAVAEMQIAILRRRLNFRPLAVRVLIANSLGGGAAVIVAVLGYGVWALVVQQLAIAGLSSILLWVWSDWRPRSGFSSRHFRELFSFGGPMTVTSILWALSSRGDRLLIGRLLGTHALGAYAVGSRAINMIVQLISSTMVNVGLPVFSRLQADLDRLRRGYLKALRLNCLAVLPAYAGFFALAPELIPALFGDGWDDAIPIMRALSVFGIGQTLQSFAFPVINALGKPIWVTVIAGVSAVLTLGGIALASPYGLEAVAWAIAARPVLVMPFTLGAVRRVIPVSVGDWIRAFGVPMLASAAIATIALAVSQALAGIVEPLLLRLLLASACGAGSYGVLVRLFAPELFAEAANVLGQALPARLRPWPSEK